MDGLFTEGWCLAGLCLHWPASSAQAGLSVILDRGCAAKRPVLAINIHGEGHPRHPPHLNQQRCQMDVAPAVRSCRPLCSWSGLCAARGPRLATDTDKWGLCYLQCSPLALVQAPVRGLLPLSSCQELLRRPASCSGCIWVSTGAGTLPQGCRHLLLLQGLQQVLRAQHRRLQAMQQGHKDRPAAACPAQRGTGLWLRCA